MTVCRCITGIVVEEGGTVGQAGLTVQLGLRGRPGFQAVASARTGPDGRFSIDLGPFEANGGSGTNWTLRVLSGVTELKAHGDTHWSEGVDARGLVICVHFPERCATPDPATPQQTVSGWGSGIYGRIVHVDGTPCSTIGVDVRVVGVGGETVISTGTTNSAGYYALAGPGAGADVLVKAFDTGPRLVGTTKVAFNCPANHRMDLEICDEAWRGASEFARIDGALDPLRGATAPSALTTASLAWMSGKAGWALPKVLDWAVARRLAVSLSLTAEPVYGLICEGFPKNADGLLAQPPSAVVRALYAAKRKNTIALGVGIPGFLAALAASRAAALDNGDDTLGAILRTSQLLSQPQALNDTKIAAFCLSYAGWTGTEADFWAQVPSLGFSNADVDEAKRLIKLGTIGLSHAPCVTAMLHELGTGAAYVVAGWSVATWDKIAGNESTMWTWAVSPIPVGLDSTALTERALLSQLLRENAHGEFRAENVRSALAAGLSGFTHMASFFARPGNADLDLETAKLSAGNLDAGTTTDELDEARKAQRLYRMTPATDPTSAMSVLANAGYTSAREVARTGRSRFLADYVSNGGDEDTAREVFVKGESQAGMSAAVFMQAHPSLTRLPCDFVPDDGALLASVNDDVVPGWEGLFSQTSAGCACRWCQSIHGPSAYLVDLLHWLSAKAAPSGSTGPATALVALTNRRPDLAALKLTCENTERVLPYIDLSLEILENVVANGGVTSAAAHDSEVETAEQLAAPQYLEATAYDASHLGGAAVAAKTPFHRALVEMRPYLAHLGLDRTDLMRDFGAAAPASPTPRHIACEELSLSVAAAVVIETANTTVISEAPFWPLADLTVPPSVRSLRRAAEVGYPDILDLLHARVANPAGGNVLGVVVTGSDPFDVGAYLIGRGSTPNAPLPAQFSRLRQFVRLWKATGWTVLEVDKVLWALGPTDPGTWSTSAPILAVGDLHRLCRMTGISPVEAASWFDDIDTWEDRDTKSEPVPSWWDQTWLKPSLFSQAEIATAGFPFALNGGRTQVVNTALILLDYADKLAAVLGIDEAEVRGVVALLIPVLDHNATPVPTVTRRNLSILYRWASLGRVLGLSPIDAWTLADITGAAPFANAHAAIELIEEWAELKAGGWTVDEVDYLLRHHATDRVPPSDDFLRLALGRIRDGLLSAMGSTTGGTTLETLLDDLGRRVSEELGLDRAVVDELRAEPWTYGAPTMPSGAVVLLPAAAAVTLAGTGPFSASVQAGARFTLLANCAFDDASLGSVTVSPGSLVVVESDTADVELPTGQSVVLPSGAEIVVDGTTPYTIAADGAAALPAEAEVTLLSSSPHTVVVVDGANTYRGSFTADASIEALDTVDATFASDTDTTAPTALQGNDLLRRLLRVAFWDVEIDTASGDPYEGIARDTTNDHEDDYAALELLFKAGLFWERLGADADERAACRAQLAALQILDPALLALFDITGSLPTAYARLKRAIDLFALRARLPGDEPTFAAIVNSPSASAVAERTDWDADTLGTLFGWMGTATVAGLTLLLDRMDAIRRAGAGPSAVANWSIPGTLADVTDDVGRSVVAAARSRYSTPEAWTTVARPLRDPVRKAQRDALVSYLIADAATDDIEDADDLYEQYLIDVSMNPEMLTSRIKQAACSVQLFIHRCLFGLENDGTYDLGDWFNDDDRADWEWMRTYRIWEAARKVFLYPENWIEPELRDDKTPFFRTLEKELAQGDVDADRSESVLLDYLDRLHEVASLKVLATYVQNESDADGTIDNLHVFARTRSDPPTYWYRRREDSATWTAWEKIEAGIQGDHLVPVVYNRRLMLLWGEFTQTQSDSETATVTAWWEVRLAMSEYRDGRWSPKKVGTDPLSLQSSALSAHSLNMAALDRYGFLSSVDEDNNLTFTLFGALSVSAIPRYTNFYQIGTFDLDACTMEVVPSYALAVSTDRLVLDANYWSAPGFSTVSYDEDLDRADHLSVNLGEADPAGEPAGDFGPVEILASCQGGKAIVPSQWQDFVSQSPFFLSVGGRVYFVEPGEADTIVEVPQQEGDPTSAPSMSAMTAMRGGTSSYAASTSTLTDEQAANYAQYLDPGSYGSVDDAVEAIQTTDEALVTVDDSEAVSSPSGGYRFSNFYHPLVCSFVKEVRRNGAFGLLDPDPEGTAKDLYRQALVTGFSFESTFSPTDRVQTPYPVEDVDFDNGGAYSQYNWEVFFHLPFYVASRLADAGRFDDALDWLHCVFDPRTRTASAAATSDPLEKLRWWKLKPFMTPASSSVNDWIGFSGADGNAAEQESFERQTSAWREDPFNPHLLARLRPGTYQKAFVMRYLDTLIGWGDQLFTRDTIETLNEATQLYVFAKKVLGDRPEELEPAGEATPQSYSDLASSLDSFGNALVAIENSTFSARGHGRGAPGSSSATGLGYSTYFCIPPNAKLLSYWDTVEDRLYKLRNGMNIEGVARSLPLFEPPIDPAMLVRAAASGLDIGAAVDGLSVDRPNQRFPVLLGRAQSLAGNVKALGGALLSALEKRDAEQLAVLRQGHEESLNSAVIDVRERQLAEAKENRRALDKQKGLVLARKSYYEKLTEKGWIGEETSAVALTDAALSIEGSLASIALIRSIMALIPEVAAGIALHFRFGGTNIKSALEGVGSALGSTAGAMHAAAGRLTTLASYKRREQEWKFQKRSAEKELAQLEVQMMAADVRVEIARRELANQRLQVTHSSEVRDWMERKYTNAELYDWTVSQLSTLHFQGYQLALATAKKAQACYQYELGPDEQAASFVQAIYWDSLRKGLLAGERLGADLDRMDLSYMENDAREFELVKHVSLARLDPLALEMLKSGGECWFEVPKVWFDIDCPGHYYRRIQSVAVSLACVAGLNGTVNAQLTLHGHATETSASTTDPDWQSGDYSAIVTSAAVNDTGLFSADPKDPRYLPFERRGAISRWHLRLTAQTWRQLDWNSITDITLHMRYTARDGGASARVDVEGGVGTALAALRLGFPTNAFAGETTTGPAVAFSAKRDASDAWFEAQDGASAFELELDASMFPDNGVTYSRVVVIPLTSATTPVLAVNGSATGWTGTGTTLGGLTLTTFSKPSTTIAQTDTLSVTITGIASLDDLIVVLLK